MDPSLIAKSLIYLFSRALFLDTYQFADDTQCLAQHRDLNAPIDFISCYTVCKKLGSWFRTNKTDVNVIKLIT
jgi:hypothetical protein